MRIELARAALAVACAAASPLAAACGYCIEDRVAAVYDHDVIEAAVSRHRHVAFLSVEGSLEANEASRRALVAALEAGGGVKGTARVAMDSAACSISYDPARTSLAKLVAAANRPLAAKGLALAPLRLIDEGGKLREP